MSDGGSAKLRRGADALSKFAGGLADALTTFEKSPGSSAMLDHHALDRQSFSGTNIPFSEASGLSEQYGHVHECLKEMSHTLSMHIEALQLAAQSADGTYDGTEEEVRRRFWEIKTRLDVEYQKSHPAQEQPQHEQPKKDPRQHAGGKSAGVNYQ